jgi:DHA2 family multidrug resistance protein-like MFS transporter
MSNEFGGTLGAAVFGTIGFAVYRTQVADAIPAGLPSDVAAAARDSIAGATAVASGLPHQVATALLLPARVAFTNGLNTVAAIGSLLIATTAVLMATLLRHVPPIGAPKAGEDGAVTEAASTEVPADEAIEPDAAFAD